MSLVACCITCNLRLDFRRFLGCLLVFLMLVFIGVSHVSIAHIKILVVVLLNCLLHVYFSKNDLVLIGLFLHYLVICLCMQTLLHFLFVVQFLLRFGVFLGF